MHTVGCGEQAGFKSLVCMHSLICLPVLPEERSSRQLNVQLWWGEVAREHSELAQRKAILMRLGDGTRERRRGEGE